MRGNRRERQDVVAERAARIEQVVGDAVHARDSGTDVDDAEIVKRHPDLAPELERRLCALRAMEAAQRPEQDGSADAAVGVPPVQEDLEFLRGALKNYEILDRINYGGQGIVYKAVQRRTRRTVAIKVLLDGPLASERQRRRFLREIELTSRLQHPNIVALYESDAVRGRVYCAMEYIEGVPLDDYALLHGLSTVQITRLFTTVVRGVSYAHQQGIIHRDLNPGNVLVDLDGVPRILDFGLAKDVWGDGGLSADVSLTMPGQVVGTLPYLSPEQAGGQDGEADVRSDIYSLGVMLFELLTGAFPYPVDGDPPVVRANIVGREPMRLSKLIAPGSRLQEGGASALVGDLEAILLKALTKDKAYRYQSAAAFADDLERCLAGEVVEARADRRYYLLQKTFRKYRMVATVAGLLLLIVAAATIAVTAMWAQARVQRDNARAMARIAIGTLDDVITCVDDAVRPLAGGMDVRDQLLNDVVAGRLALLAPLVESDAAMEDVRAALYEKQGDIAYARGSHVEAARSYQRFLELVGPEAQAAGPSDEQLGVAARAQRKLAGVVPDADVHFRQALALGEAQLTHDPSQPAAKYGLCMTRVEYGRQLYLRGEYEAAAQQIGLARALAEPMVGATGRDERWIKLLARTYGWEGDSAVALGEGGRGVAALTGAVALCRELCAARPADVDRRHQVLVMCARLARALRNEGRFEEATAAFEEAASVGAYLTGVDPTVAAWQRDLLSVHYGLAQLCLSRGDLERGPRHCAVAVELAQQLMSREPTNPTWRGELAFARDLRGQVHMALAEPDRARDELEAALEIWENLLAESPGDLALCKRVGTSHTRLGWCWHRLGDPEQSLRHKQHAHAIAETLCAQQPAVTQRAIDLIRAKINLAAGHMMFHTLEDDAAAEALLRTATDSLEGLCSAGKLEQRAETYSSCMAAIARNLETLAGRPDSEELPGSAPLDGQEQ